MGVRLTVTVRGIPETLRRLEQATGRNLEEAAREGLMNAAIDIAEDAKDRVPYDSGDLRRAIYAEPVEDEMAARVVVPPVHGVPYGVYQHEGTGIHGPTGQPIRPRTAKVLRWWGKGAPRGRGRRAPGSWRFAREVRGVKPTPFLLDAAEAARAGGRVQAHLAEALNRALRRR